MIDKAILEAQWRDFVFFSQAVALLTLVVALALVVVISLAV
jgi:hypothetical protein